MKRISNANIKRYYDLVNILTAKSSTAQTAISKIEHAISEAESLIQNAIDNAIDVLAEADDVRQEAYDIIENAHDEAEAHYDERSDRWKMSDCGGQYEDWIERLDTLRNALAEPIELCDTEPSIELDTDVEFATDSEDLSLPQSPDDL